MFEAQLSNAGFLKKIIAPLVDIVSDAPFDCGKEGITLHSMDASHVALVSTKLSVKLFEAYRCDRNTLMGINLTNLNKALKCANDNDNCILRYKEDETHVTFIFHDKSVSKTQEVVVKLMNIDCERLDIPDQKYAVTINMSSTEFLKICRDLIMFGDSVTITANDQGLTFSGNGESGSYVMSFNRSNDIENNRNRSNVNFEILEDVTSTFSVKYLLSFSKSFTVAERVRLAFSSEIPLLVEYKMDKNFGYIRYYLAAKLNDIF